MIERCLIVDVETTGVEETAEAIELGWILYSVRNHTSLVSYATLLQSANGNPAETINRIPPDALVEMSDVGWHKRLHQALPPKRYYDCFVAHNAQFDRKFFPAELDDLPWLCTMNDFKWPQVSRQGESLVTLALDHGIGVSSTHRALTDCRLIAALFDRMDDLPAMFEVAMRPKALFQALVSYDDRQLAKDAGFKWEAESRRWVRTMAIEDAGSLPFRVAMLSE